MVLNLHTWLVITQFHVKHDTIFDTANQLNIKSQCKKRAGFSTMEEQNITSLRKHLNSKIENKNRKRKIPTQHGKTILDNSKRTESKQSVRFAKIQSNRWANIIQRRNYEVPQDEVIQAAATSPCKGSPQSKSQTEGTGVTCTPEELNISPEDESPPLCLIELSTMEITHIHNKNTKNMLWDKYLVKV